MLCAHTNSWCLVVWLRTLYVETPHRKHQNLRLILGGNAVRDGHFVPFITLLASSMLLQEYTDVDNDKKTTKRLQLRCT